MDLYEQGVLVAPGVCVCSWWGCVCVCVLGGGVCVVLPALIPGGWVVGYGDRAVIMLSP